MVKRKIAIIEDEAEIARLYKLKFERSGYEVVTAADGVQALEVLERARPDIILLDVLLPRASGDELLAKVRATDWGKDIKVVVMTNVSRQEAPDAFNRLNISRYIVKADMTPDEIEKLVKEELS